MPEEITAKKYTYMGIFMITLATLMYEILLTRIFSVTMWYHFAFMAVSIALFGMTVGAIIVYLFPSFFSKEKVFHRLMISSISFSVLILVSFWLHLFTPFGVFDSIAGLFFMAFTYVIIAVPFVFSGISVALVLTKFPRQIGKLYAADLIGAAIGTFLLIYVLSITDALTAVILVSGLAALGAVFFAAELRDRRSLSGFLIVSIALLLFAGVHTVLVNNNVPLLSLEFVKGNMERPALYEKWNSFSRVHIAGGVEFASAPLGTTLSSKPSYPAIEQLYLTIDASASTVLTGYDGNPEIVSYLKYDVANLAHYIRKDADVAVIGVGGGRDILSALVFDQHSVLGIELNGAIIDAVVNKFGDFTGNLHEDPRVTFVQDEARSYLTREEKEFDIIQISMIDTWAATAAGAFILSENALYTTNAWEIFFDRLKPDGILSLTRWYFGDPPGEIARVVALANQTLREQGVKAPNNHIVVVRFISDERREKFLEGVGTVLVSKSPFLKEEVETLQKVADDLGFEIIQTPSTSVDPILASLASTKDLNAVVESLPLDVSPPTDDNPFFFHMLRVQDIFDRTTWAKTSELDFNLKAVVVLGTLLIVVIVLTLICIVVPLIVKTKKGSLRGTFPFFLFFASIGFGFMLIEISQMQRLILFLGHPVYSLSVVLFSLLLASGIGSYMSEVSFRSKILDDTLARLWSLLVVLALFGWGTPFIVSEFTGSGTVIRILLSIAILFPLGLFLGMAFPLGMKLASARFPRVTPWLWGINGATSVVASVLAIVIALISGITVTFWVGFTFYCLAFISFVWASRKTLP